MNLSKWGEAIGIIAVVLSLLFVGYEVRQNTSQLRVEGARALTEIVNDTNAGIYENGELAEIVIRGKQDLGSLNPIERERFDRFWFARLNIAEYVLDLEKEGVSGLNFDYVEWIVRDFNQRPGLRTFIREYANEYDGSEELLSRLLGKVGPEQ